MFLSPTQQTTIHRQHRHKQCSEAHRSPPLLQSPFRFATRVIGHSPLSRFTPVYCCTGGLPYHIPGLAGLTMGPIVFMRGNVLGLGVNITISRAT
jgi:hypothetical protein